jgi:hypothetical protein
MDQRLRVLAMIFARGIPQRVVGARLRDAAAFLSAAPPLPLMIKIDRIRSP